MNNRPQFAGISNNGFTLLELLLVLVLLLFLFGAAVFEFNSMGRGASVSAGGDRLESLFRFARSESERTGRKIRIRFAAKDTLQFAEMNLAKPDGGNSPVPLSPSPDRRGLIAEWEPNPLDQPGQFAQIPQSVHFTDGVDNLVMVDSVKLTDLDSQLASQLSANATLSDSNSTTILGLSGPSVIHFYPDGSCDSVKVQLADRNPDNPNKEIVELIGLTGSVHRETIEITSEQTVLMETNGVAQPVRPSGQAQPKP